MMAGRYLERRGWTKNWIKTGPDLNTMMSSRLDVSVETVIGVAPQTGAGQSA
jgi:hypothetical protein